MAIVDKYISHITPLDSPDTYKLKAYLLKNGRTFKVKLDSANASTAFDGSANITDIGVSGILGTANGGTGNTSFTANRLIYTNTASKFATGTIESDGNNIILGDGDYSLSRTARGGNWNQGVSKALIKITSATGAYPLFAMKSHSGYWLMTQYEQSSYYNHLIFGFLSDVDIYGTTNAKNHYDYKVRLIPTIYETNTETITDRAFVTANYDSNSAQTGNTNQPIYINNQGVATAISLKPTLNNLLSSLTEGTADALVDAGYIISTNNNGATNDWYLRSNVTIWNYIKNHITNDLYWANIKVQDSSATNKIPSFSRIVLTNTGATSISLSRTDGANYIDAPEGGGLAVSIGGVALANSPLVVLGTSVYPGKTNTYQLGTSSYLWKKGFINEYYLPRPANDVATDWNTRISADTTYSFKIEELGTSTTNKPTNHWYYGFIGRGADRDYLLQIGFGETTTRVVYRAKISNNWSGMALYDIPSTGPVAIGSGVKLVYLNSNGFLQASTSTVGTFEKPVYLNAGTITTLNPVWLLSGGTATANDEDLNAAKYKVIGNYYSDGDAKSRTILNSPFGAAASTNCLSFTLKTEASLGTGTTYLRQLWRSYNSGVEAERTSGNSGSSWSTWRTKVFKNSDATTAAGNSTTPVYVTANGAVATGYPYLRYINSTDVTTYSVDELGKTASIAYIRATDANAPASGHMMYINAGIGHMGTPFQIGIHDSSNLYIYKRWYSSSAWSAWTKMNAGNADTASQVYSTHTYPTTRSYIEYQQNQSTGSGNVSLRHHNALSVSSNMDTTNTSTRWTELWIGNATASGTVGNSQGWLALYTSGVNYTQISAYGTGNNNYFNIPNYSGTGYALTSSTLTKGSATKGIYITTNGQAEEMSHELKATVNSGTANRAAYYSAAGTIEDAGSIYMTASRLGVNATTYQHTLGGTSSVSDFTFSVLGNGFIRDTIYTNTELRVYRTAAGNAWRVFDDAVAVGSFNISAQGTTSQPGLSYITIGNTLSATTKGNAKGRLYLGKQGAAWHVILGENDNATNHWHYLPDATGWIVTAGNGTSTGQGGTEQPVYVDVTGVVKNTTYHLKAHVEDGTATRLAYYSAARTIDYASNIQYIPTQNAELGTTKGSVNGLFIYGPAYGNETANLGSATINVFRYGDPGPQIRFSTGLGTANAGAAESSAIIWSDHSSSIGTDQSFHFVGQNNTSHAASNVGVVTNTFIGKTRISAGVNYANTNYVLFSNGTSGINGQLYLQGASASRDTAPSSNDNRVLYFTDAARNDQSHIYFRHNTAGTHLMYLNTYSSGTKGTRDHIVLISDTDTTDPHYIQINSRISTNLNISNTRGFAYNKTDTPGVHISNAGRIYITANSNTVTIGSQNANYTHIYNSANIPFIVNKSLLTAAGDLGNTSYPWNNIVLGNSAGTANADIILHSSQANNTMIRFLVQTSNGNGQGIRIGGGGLTIIGGGESAATVQSGTGYANDAEQMLIANDNEIRFYPNQGSAYTASALIQMTAGRIWAGVNGDTTRENQVGVQSGAGQLYMYSAASATGAKGIYFSAHGDSSAGYIARVDSAHRVYYNDNFTSQRVKLIANQGSQINSGVWLRTCIVQSYQNYANFQIRLTGGWSTGSPTIATIDVNMRKGQASMKLVHRGFLGVIGKVKLVKLETNTAYLDVYVREASNNTDYFGQFIGNVTVTQNDNTTHGTTNVTTTDDTGLDVLDLTVTVGNASTPVYIDATGNPVACTAYSSATNIRAATVNIHDDTTSKLFVLGATTTGYTSIYRESSVYMQNNVLMGAAWNDYAEFRQSKENKIIEPGRVVYENGDDTLSISNDRLMRGCSIVSDTYGFGIGESEEAQLPIAVSGRVLAYPYEDREEFKNHIGWPVCSGPNGTVSIMTEEEEMKYPSRIIGIISAVPDYKVWHGGVDVVVDRRVWIKVR